MALSKGIWHRSAELSYSELLNDSIGAKDRGRLEGQHGLVALSTIVSQQSFEMFWMLLAHVEGAQILAVGIEGIVVELDELLLISQIVLVSRGV